ncbi:MAG: TMEM43 family protein [Firmicutes bacterium]|nr:TMEM43 family protein [Bacillota bacterium]
MANHKKRAAEEQAKASLAQKKKSSPAFSIVMGIILIVIASVCVVASLSDAAYANEAIKYFNANCYQRSSGTYDENNTGYAVVVIGDFVYDEGGAADPIFGVSVDSVLLYRTSEMYQWTLNDEGVYELIWSEELIDSSDYDDEHQNPTSYPSNLKSNYYSAHNVTLGDYSVSDEQLLLIESDSIASLPLTSVDVNGYSVAEGSYITNSEDYSSPEAGDVRISYSYVTTTTATLVGKQRTTNIVSFNYDDGGYVFFRVLDGKYYQSDVVALYYSEAPNVMWLLFIAALIVAVFGGTRLYDGLAGALRYTPTLAFFGRSAAGVSSDAAAYVYGGVFGAAVAFIVGGAVWSGANVYFLGAATVFALCVILLIGYDFMTHLPERDPAKDAYTPIIRHSDK